MSQMPHNGISPGMGMNPGMPGVSGSFAASELVPGGGGDEGMGLGMGNPQNYQPNYHMPGVNQEVMIILNVNLHIEIVAKCTSRK